MTDWVFVAMYIADVVLNIWLLKKTIFRVYESDDVTETFSNALVVILGLIPLFPTLICTFLYVAVYSELDRFDKDHKK